MGELIKVKIAKVPKGTVRSGGRTSGSISSGASIEFAQRAVYAHYADEADKATQAERAKEADRLTSEAVKDLERAVLSKLFIPYLDTTAKTWADVRKDEDFNSVKIKTSLWTDGFMSARGLNPNGGGSGTGGKSYLSDLLDVDLGTLSSGQVLTWNGTKWVNSALTLPDMAGYALESWVEANFQPKGDYLTNSAALSTYVSKAGDSMTGALNICNSEQTQIWLNSNGTSETGIGFKVDGATLGWVGYNAYRGTVLHTYDGGHYLGIYPNGTPRFDGNVIWHAGNDGAGSGLDADLLDGNHLADILASNVASASRLQTAHLLWGQRFDGTSDVSGLIKAESGIKIGSCTITWDSANGMLRFDKGLYSEGAVSARGVNANGSTGSGTGMDVNASNATHLAMPNLVAQVAESYDLFPYDSDYFVVGDSSYGYDYCAKFKMTALWRYIKDKADKQYVPTGGNLIASFDGDNVALSCRPGTLRINGNCAINSGGVISSVGANIGGLVSAYGFALTGPSPAVKVTYQDKTYTLQLAKLIEDGYLA